MADLHNYIWHRMVLVHFRAYVHIWYHHDIMLYMYLTDTGALERMSTWTDELRLCECMYKGSTYNALYHCIKVNIYERIWPHMRQMVGRELGESLVAKLVSSTSWENLRPATSRGSATGAKQLLPWIATPPPTILTSSPSRICCWSMLSVQDYTSCYRFAKYHTRYQKPKNISGLPSSNNSVAFEEKWDGIICLLGRSRGEDLSLIEPWTPSFWESESCI